VPPAERVDQVAFHIQAEVIQLLNDGVVCDLGKTSGGGADRSPEQIVILGDFPQLAVGSHWEGEVFPAGRAEYVARNGAKRTVRAVATSRQLAEQHVSSPMAITHPAAVPAFITPPFGLRWGEGSERLERLMKGAGARIVSRDKSSDGEIWHVEGLVQDGLKETQFALKKSELASVSLIYTRPDWNSGKYADFYRQVEKRISDRYGDPGTVAAPAAGEARAREDGMAKSKEAEWQRAGTAIRLVFLESEDASPARALKVQYSRDAASAAP
jgi:hypothetical protein